MRSPRASNIEIRADDPTLTGHASLLLTKELAARTDLVSQLDSIAERFVGTCLREVLDHVLVFGRGPGEGVARA